MQSQSRLWLIGLLVVLFVIFQPGYSHADDEDEEEEVFEDAGELIGWASIITASGAALIFPLRRVAPAVMRNFKDYRTSFRKFLLLYRKWHIGFGILALSFAIFHGVLMYMLEGKLEFRDYLGIGGVTALICIALSGSMFVNRANSVLIRICHVASVVLLFIFAAAHIALS